MNIQYNRATQKVTFDVAGTSTKVQNVTASLTVLAYGQQVYQKDFNPCDSSTPVQQLCPVPSGTFSATGEQDIPTSYANQIPSIAFTVPDLDGTAKLELKAADGGNDVACIESVVDNGKTMSTKAVPIVAAGICGAALVVSGLSAAMGGTGAGSSTPSPTFTEVFGWFQGMAMNGMLSVNYPSVYRSFTKNFAFSTGLIPWDGLETSIDNFRKATGGNLTTDSVAYLRNSTLVYQGTTNVTKRSFIPAVNLFIRDVSTSASSSTSTNGTSSDSKTMHFVHGIQGYVEALTIPQANTFMTVLLMFAIVIASIVVGILLFKVILEAWSIFGNFPKRLTGFRKRYWWIMAKTITNLILLLYGVWTLYCVYQFTRGDSWAAKLLAGVTLGVFTVILAYFTFMIWRMAKKYKKAEGDASGLFDDKETWRKYSLFYENYKKSYWWLFLPAIVYMAAKGIVIAAGDGHGMIQTAGQLIIEALMLVLLLWSRPYSLKSGNVINIIIQFVRVLSVLCILVFVEQLGISQTPKTITGVVLIVMQSVLTGLLAILIAVNAIVVFFRANPHRKARKEAEKLNRDLDNLTPLDARNSLLLSPEQQRKTGHLRDGSDDSFHYRDARPYTDHEANTAYLPPHHREPSVPSLGGGYSVRGASPAPSMRQPLLPQIDPSFRGRGY